MPFSTVFTVSNPPRTWSSYTNIRIKDVQQLKTMNSTEGLSRYKEINDYADSPTLSRRLLGYGYELPDNNKASKKEKKWSIGSLFRRKKKDESDNSSSDDDPQKKSTFLLNRKKQRKSDKTTKRKPKTLGTFDHVVISQNSHLYSNGHQHNDDNGVLSDPTGGFTNYNRPKILQTPSQDFTKPVKSSRESLDDLNNSRVSLGSSFGDSSTKRNRKGLAKIRAEARRLNFKNDSSSDEDSQRSASSLKFRSDENLGIPGSRRSRSARTERYLRRHSKDGENQSTKITKSDIENAGINWKLSDESNRSLSRSPLVPSINTKVKTSYSSLSSQSPSISGLSTIPPSHGSHSRIRVSNSTSNPSYKPPISINDYNYNVKKLPYDDYFNNQRSVSYDANIHKSPSTEMSPEIIHAQLALGKPNTIKQQRNLSLIDRRHVNSVKQPPPPPPPRDPKRLITVQHTRPTTYYFDGVGQIRSKSFYTNPTTVHDYQMKKFNSFNLHTNGRSTSEDQLIHNSLSNLQLLPRPSSATPEVNTNHKTNQNPDRKINQDNYNYLMDKKPRSRRPIFIQTNGVALPITQNNNNTDKSDTQKALDFWREKDKEAKSKPKSPQMFTCQTQVQTQIFLPSVLHSDMNSENFTNSTDSLPRTKSPLRQTNLNGNSNQINTNDNLNEDEIKQKSTNLEEALDELEAIYNSLKLGDEDLLERAEQREKDVVNQKIREGVPVWGGVPTRGALSDSSFSYEPFDTVDSPRRKRLAKRSQTIDRRTDDMAFRKLNKDHANTINDPQSVLAKLSYLQTSPVYGKEMEDINDHKKCKEPDVTLDDVVYRNVKFANSSPKIVEPQPPFGIPIGPITLAANSDYLHAVPEDIPRPTFKPCKIPDLVKDDLAFRNLRKDASKEPALPPLSSDDLRNNNNNRMDINSLKKKRAVRSLSANIGSLIDKNVLAKRLEKHKENNNVENEFKTLTDIADAMEIARQVLKEKEHKINNTRKAFLSDTDTNIVDDPNSLNYDKLTERRLNFLNSLKTPILQTHDDNTKSDNYKLQTKAPAERRSPRSPKESTPIPLSLLERKLDDAVDDLHQDFDDLLTALAAEARETSERITKELEEFDEETRRLNNNDQQQDIDVRLSEIDAVSEQAKLCEKLLEGVVDSTDFRNHIEKNVELDNIKPVVANVIMTREDVKNVQNNTKNCATIESDHDYENLLSDEEIEQCTSPFEEHKAELIASFQELKKNIDLDIDDVSTMNSNREQERENMDELVTGKHSPRRSRSRLPRWLRPHSSGSLSDSVIRMSEVQETRAERIARYKEERRRQLASQFGTHTDQLKKTKDSPSSSSDGSGGPRSTRTSRLRATALENRSNTTTNTTLNSKEKSRTSPSGSRELNPRIERDKSSKRKSNLNRALNCEEVPNTDDDLKSRRRRRRFFPQEILEQNIVVTNNKDDRTKSETSITANTSLQSSFPSQSSLTNSKATCSRKSELSIHMENARKGIQPSYSEIGKSKTSARRGVLTKISSPKEKSPKPSTSDVDNTVETEKESKMMPRRSNRISSKTVENRNITKKMEDLTALTKETLARVERLTHKTKESIKTNNNSTKTLEFVSKSVRNQPSSILKKKSIEEPSVEAVPNHLPVSILKRKVSQDDHHQSHLPSSATATATHTPPVTFSPNVVEPTTTNRKQGILKKRRSLDESQVMRHRSCSPDVSNKTSTDSRSILKNQRRSSLEELRRTQSPETQLHGILKRKPLRNDDEDQSLNSPQSILKRRSGASSAGSTNSTPHVSITTAVILAAAGGAEMVLESPPEPVKPILKKKSFSEEHSYNENLSDIPKPILKKKSSTDTDDCEDKPKPILKISKNATDKENHVDNSGDNDGDFKTVLKQPIRDEVIRPRLSFCSPNNNDNDTNNDIIIKHTRRSNTICTEFNIKSREIRDEDHELKKPRPLSVSELVMSFENSISTGAIPKKSNLKRRSDRCKTQPVTSNELEASLSLVESPRLTKPPLDDTSDDLLNYTTSLENDSKLNNYLSSSFHITSPDSGVKMSSDSAFQSLGDGLELDQDDDDNNSTPNTNNKSHEPPPRLPKIDLQMKAIADEAKRFKREKDKLIQSQSSRNRRSNTADTSRFSTQPVTFNEVQEASKINENLDNSEERDDVEPFNLSLLERIKLFNEKVDKKVPQKRNLPRDRVNRFSTQPVTFSEVQEAAKFKENLDNSEDEADVEPSELSLRDRIGLFNKQMDKRTLQKRDRFSRSSTQPVTCDEVETACSLFTRTHPLDEKSSSERKGILKSNSTVSRLSGSSSPLLTTKSVLKRRDSLTRLNQSNEISDITYDEGISCNDSGSDSENANVSFMSHKNVVDIERYHPRSVSPTKYHQSNSETSDGGDSSGSREVRKIFRNENKLRVKQALETVLSKSKSQGIIGDEQDSSINRKATTSIRRSQTQTGMPRTIAELQAKLQESGESSWKKRLQNNNSNDELKSLKDKNKYNDELSEKSILALKKDELDAASQQWKTRVEKSDAQKFSVAGRMEKKMDGKIDDLPINIPIVVDKNKRTPQAKRYKGKEDSDLSSVPVSPHKSTIHELTRSFSVPERNQDFTGADNSLVTGRKVAIIRPDDYTFKSFFKNIEENKTIEHVDDINLDDFDLVPRQSLLVTKKNVQIQKRRGASKNPIKALASRTDISDEYTEIITGVAEREKKRLNIEKLAKSSNLAIEALAGLASKEDFTNVALKKSTSSSSLVPFKSVMLLHVKGRRHVQTRLVEPTISSINEGDNFILITSNALYNYIGTYANVIEQSRAADIVNHIQQTGDLGCKVNEVITINTKNASTTTRQINEFWKILGCNESQNFIDGGNPNEDEIYESNILSTNMIYKLENNELVPYEEYWGTIPKIEMLEPTKVLVFDFGTEMYVWSGKNAPFDEKRRALKLAKDLWDEGYNYMDCNICPINVASILGDRTIVQNQNKIGKRPEWALFAKITQHRETILFKEKFLDWPDFSRVIRVKRDDDNNKLMNASYDIRPCDVEMMLNKNETEPDLIVEGYHLGRGNEYFDDETKRLFEFDTLNITMWRILENNSEKLCDNAVGHFYDGDSYIIRWCYRMTVKGRELSGKPSKYSQTGRDRCIYFCWQGIQSSINEKGCAALLTVELDNENAPQIRVVQGLEPAAFLGIFNGSMVVHQGKRDEFDNDGKARLFMIKGELEREVSLIEVPCNCEQLRSRTSFILINNEDGEIYIWHGSKSSQQTRKLCRIVADRIADEKPKEFHLNHFVDDIDVIEVEEGDDENNKIFEFLEGNSNNYYSLLDNNLNYDYTIRLFYLSSLSGTFKATELLCPYRSQFSSPYPFQQSELYSASQPALFLIDNHHELWLWQGWWPETEENVELSEQTGSGAVRWQAERKATMQTAVDYWRKSHDDDESIPIYLVWAGFEPLEFKNLFPNWIDNEEVIELNSKEGKRKTSKVLLERELALLSRTTYPLVELLQRPLPEGVDPTQLEIYLSTEDFQEALSMNREEFQKLPLWKQTAIKKEKGLF